MNGPQNNQTELGFAQNAKVPIGIRKKKVITKEHRQKISHSLMGIERKPIIERFMSHVKISGTGCWEWFGCKKPGGYGVFSIKKNNIHKTYNAHRWSYQYYIGNIPEGLVIDHLCRVRHCVNPIHMELVTMRENLMRGTGF